MNEAQLEKWAGKAAARKPDRSSFASAHLVGDRLIGTDGNRIHVLHRATKATAGEAPPFTPGQLENLERILLDGSTAKTRGMVSTEHLTAVTRNAQALGNAPVFLMLRFNGQLEASARVPEIGQTAAALVDGLEWKGKTAKKDSVVVYRKTGPDSQVAVNTRFLLDALAGMSEAIDFSVMRVAENFGHLHLRSGRAEAVIAGVNEKTTPTWQDPADFPTVTPEQSARTARVRA